MPSMKKAMVLVFYNKLRTLNVIELRICCHIHVQNNNNNNNN